MKNKHPGLTTVFIVLIYISLVGDIQQHYYQIGKEVGFAFFTAALESLVISAVMMAIPFICKIIKGDRMTRKKGKLLCLFNSIFWFAVPILIIGRGFLGGIGAIFFYFINKWMFVDESNTSSSYEKDANQIVRSTPSVVSGWRCQCGRIHANYVSSCVCGQSKPDKTAPVQEAVTKPAPVRTVPPMPTAVASQPVRTTSPAKTPAQVRFCRKCGTKLAGDGSFCHICGTQIKRS